MNNELTPAEQSHEMILALRRVVRKLQAHSRDMARSVSLTIPQYLCLRAILDSADPSLTLSALAKAVQLSPSTMSNLVERMVKLELVERVRSVQDRRKVALALSPKGRELITNLKSPLQDSFERKLMALPPVERATLLESLATVVHLLGADQAPPAVLPPVL